VKLKAKFESGSSHVSLKRLVPGAFNVGLIGSTCTALPDEEAAEVAEVAVVREFRLVTFVPWSKGLHSALHYSDTL